MIIEIFITILAVVVFALSIQNVNQKETIKLNKIRIKHLENSVDNLYTNYFDNIDNKLE